MKIQLQQLNTHHLKGEVTLKLNFFLVIHSLNQLNNNNNNCVNDKYKLSCPNKGTLVEDVIKGYKSYYGNSPEGNVK